MSSATTTPPRDSSHLCISPPPALRAGDRGSVAEEDQRGLDARADLLGIREPELAEDRVDVLLHGSLAQLQILGDRAVGLAGRHLAEDLALARAELFERLRAGHRLRDHE